MRTIAIILSFAVAVAAGVNDTFIGSATSGKTSTAANWSTGAVPTIQDTAWWVDTALFPVICTVTTLSSARAHIATTCAREIRFLTPATVYTVSGNYIDSGSGSRWYGRFKMTNVNNNALWYNSDNLPSLAGKYYLNFELSGTGGTIHIDEGTTQLSAPITLNDNASWTFQGNNPYLQLATNPLWILGNNCKATINSNYSTYVYGTGTIYQLGTNDTFSGANAWVLSPNYIDFNSNLTNNPFIYTGTGSFTLRNASASSGRIGINNVFNINTRQLDVYEYQTLSSNFYFDLQGGTVTCGNLRVGNNSTAGSFRINYGNSHIKCTGLQDDYFNALGGSFDTTKTCIRSIAGSFTAGTNHTYIVGTHTDSIVAASTITSNGKTPFYNLVVNAAGAAVTFADKLRTLGSLTLLAGKITMAQTKDTVTLNYTNAVTGTDTVNRRDTVWIGGSFTRGAGSNVKTDAGLIKLFGTALCNFTSSGFRLNRFHLVGTNNTKQMKLLGNTEINYLRDTTGTINQNGFSLSDSVLVILDSNQVLDGDRVIWKYLLYGPQYEANTVTKVTTFSGSAACSLSCSSPNNIGNITENLSGAGSLMQVGRVWGDTLVLTDGTYDQSAATDTARWAAVIINTTDSVRLKAPWIVSGSVTIAAGAKLGYSGVGKIRMSGGGTLALNGNTGVPPIEIDAKTTITGGGTLASFKFTSPGDTALWEINKLFVFTGVDSIDWSGASFAQRNTMKSTIDSSRCTLDLPGNKRFTRMYWKDCVIKAPDTMTCLWSDSCRDGGGNY